MPQSRPTTTPDGATDDTTYRRPDGDVPLRDGSNPLERMALYRAGLDVGAFPATLVVQLAMWPNQVVTLARQAGRSPAMFYNALTRANGRPYHSVRRIFVGYLRSIARQHGSDPDPVTKQAIDHLLDARPAEHHGESPIAAPGRRDEPVPLPPAAAWDESRPPVVRDGSNPIERMALAALHRFVAAMPASEIVQLVLWPSSLAQWAREAELEAGAVYNTLAWRNQWAYKRIRTALADRAGVSVFAVDALIEAPRREAPPAGAWTPEPDASVQGTLPM
jgi:hypothetical protein